MSNNDNNGTPQYQRWRNENKLAKERFDHGHSGRSDGQMVSAGGNLLSGLGCCWFKGIIISLLFTTVLLIIKLGSMTIDNITNIEIISNYGYGQYFRNIYHMDRQTKYRVNTLSLACYQSEILFEKSHLFMNLKKGQEFTYHGFKIINTVTLVAIEIEADDPIHCYAVLPHKWTGKSYWDFGESDLLTEIDKAAETNR